MAEKRLAELMEQMIQDRREREQEVAAERARREEEIRAERARLEEERVTREREVQRQMNFMQEQMNRLMKVVEYSKTGDSSKLAPGSKLSVKLVALAEKDDIEAYLVTFERIMEGQKIEKANWAHYLAPQLTGKAQLAFAALPSADASNYDALKAAILIRYDINEEAYRRRFRSAARGRGETNRELAVRMMDLQAKWLRGCKRVEEIREATGIEQFLSTMGTEKRLWLLEKKPKTCIEAGELADEFEQARKGAPLEQQQGQPPKPKKCTYCGKADHSEENCHKKQAEQTGQGQQLTCFRCHKVGHMPGGEGGGVLSQNMLVINW